MVELDDLKGAKIVGFDWRCGKLCELQLKLTDGTLVILTANGSVSDKRFKVYGWLEVVTNEIERRYRKKLL